MCLGIPMQVVAVDGYNSRCLAKGVMRDVSLFMLQDASVSVGDFVIVHVGYALQKISEQEAISTWELLDEMLALEAGGYNLDAKR
jgi:hydrogenase expression/formation protein HypC